MLQQILAKLNALEVRQTKLEEVDKWPKNEDNSFRPENKAVNSEVTMADPEANGKTPAYYKILNDVFPVFSGADHEDPAEFLIQAANVLRKACIPQEAWVRMTAGKLQGAAAEWWKQRASLKTDWSGFKLLILNKFDDTTIKARLRAKLFSEQQKEREEVTMFIQRKHLLYKRILPSECEAEMVTAILELITPAVRVHLRQCQPWTIDELVTRAEAIERDLCSLQDDRMASADPGLRAGAEVHNVERVDARNTRAPRCFACGRTGHYRNECPNSVPPRRAREAEPEPEN